MSISQSSAAGRPGSRPGCGTLRDRPEFGFDPIHDREMEAVMAETLKQVLIDLEKKYWRALQKGDAETALKLTADPCIVTGAQGVARVSKKAFAGMLKNAAWEIEEFDIADV